MIPFSKEDLIVARLTEALALSFGISPNTAKLIGDAAALHDVGKVLVRRGVLLKPERLTVCEFEIVKNHTLWGAHILSNLPNLCGEVKIYATKIAALHHEKWDGTGYWKRKGGDFPYYCQMVAVSDIFIALTSAERPYKKPWLQRDALDYIASESGKTFCPDIVRNFQALFVQTV